MQVTQQVVIVNASDADSGRNAEITYSIAGGVSGDFQVNPVTVSICMKCALCGQYQAKLNSQNFHGDIHHSYRWLESYHHSYT